MYLYDSHSLLQFSKVLNQNELSNILSDSSVDQSTESNNLFVHADLITNVWSSIRHSEGLTNGVEDQEHEDKSLPVFKDGDDTHDFYRIYKEKIDALMASTSKLDAREYQIEIKLLELKKRLLETYHEESFFDKSLVVEVLI